MDTTKLNRSVTAIAAAAAVIAGGLGATAMSASASASAGPGIGGGLVGLASTVTLAPGQSTSGVAEFYNPTVGVAETATVSVGGSYIAASPTTLKLAATGQAGDQSASQRSTVTISIPASATSGTYTDYVEGQVPPVAGGNIGAGIKLPITVIVSAPKAGLSVAGSGGNVTVAPGSSTQLEFLADNTGNVPETVKITGTQVNSTSSPTVAVNGLAGIYVTVTVPKGTAAGSVKAPWTATATTATGQTATVSGYTNVNVS
ncbi:MAG TPA: hypothetical protein VLW50_24495 [Streptosporangiaceae bacterium]|nr:hypothetical protein [Streptosporangiaceae bacterium]